ncbi:16S rRNA (guanine(527)-N(7))-methyltransferase RsmG [Thiomicrospira microaerophila]|uniref:16S rRNA (guanine(527)-N(7))-methyltransferase RsmG n=1 Tax=Thiomicrospira microaerophila TaxID=406020 RepID=UPI0005CA8536|nr:16S rRNA (guanine(527)-N(7))-methyltransferase RsmG [Thiomicrospira microaerophila]
MTLEQQLKQGAAQLGLNLTDQACSQLLAYLDLLQKWNKVYNLSAIREPEQMLVKHIFDSLAVVPAIADAAPANLIDVGTGGGLPGIPLAIMLPAMPVALLDSNEKKTRFLVQVKAQLGLDNIEVFHQRVEEHDKQYEAIISRAFTALDNFVAITEPLLAEKGCWWAMKSQNLDEEMKTLPLGLVVEKTIALCVPGLDAARYLVAMRRQGE